jgi:hypothetical protein
MKKSSSILIFITSCVFVMLLIKYIDINNNHQRIQQARHELDKITPLLPSNSPFHILQTIHDDSLSDDASCVYAVTSMMIGSDISSQETINTYSTLLQKDQWFPRKESTQTSLSRVFLNGLHTSITFYVSEPTLSMKEYFDYKTARSNYPTILFVFVKYILPKTEEC